VTRLTLALDESRQEVTRLDFDLQWAHHSANPSAVEVERRELEIKTLNADLIISQRIANDLGVSLTDVQNKASQLERRLKRADDKILILKHSECVYARDMRLLQEQVHDLKADLARKNQTLVTLKEIQCKLEYISENEHIPAATQVLMGIEQEVEELKSSIQWFYQLTDEELEELRTPIVTADQQSTDDI